MLPSLLSSPLSANRMNMGSVSTLGVVTNKIVLVSSYI